VRCFVSENRDPVAKILGDRFATIVGTDNSAFRFVEEIMGSARAGGRTQAGDQADTQAESHDAEVEEKKLELRLLMLLKDYDDKMLQEAIKIISS